MKRKGGGNSETKQGWNKKTPSGPRNIQETKAWKDGVGGLGRFWGNYVNSLKVAFQRLDRRGQEELIIRMCQIMTVGAAIITTSIWYYFMPANVRVLILPVVLVGAWWLGTKIVGPSMIARFDDHMHPEE